MIDLEEVDSNGVPVTEVEGMENQRNIASGKGGFKTYVPASLARSLHARLQSLEQDKARLDWLEEQLKFGWGDGFAMQSLDSGGQYVRPWKSSLQRVEGFELISWWPTIREAIDTARCTSGDERG